MMAGIPSRLASCLCWHHVLGSEPWAREQVCRFVVKISVLIVVSLETCYMETDYEITQLPLAEASLTVFRDYFQ